MRMKQSVVAAYLGPSAASIGANTRSHVSMVIGQPSTPKQERADPIVRVSHPDPIEESVGVAE